MSTLLYRRPGFVMLDWSHRPRAGAKGAGTRVWLGAKGYGPVPAPGRAARVPGKGVLAMLGENDALVLDAAPWAFGAGGALAPHVYPTPRAEGTFWLRLEGEGVSAVLACLCGVDLGVRAFADLAAAQTLAARVSLLIIRDDSAHALGYHLVGDISFQTYLTAQLLDAAKSLEG